MAIRSRDQDLTEADDRYKEEQAKVNVKEKEKIKLE